MVGAQVSTFDLLPPNDPVAMQVAVQVYGPIAVAIAVVPSFMSYTYSTTTNVNATNISDHV